METTEIRLKLTHEEIYILLCLFLGRAQAELEEHGESQELLRTRTILKNLRVKLDRNSSLYEEFLKIQSTIGSEAMKEYSEKMLKLAEEAASKM